MVNKMSFKHYLAKINSIISVIDFEKEPIGIGQMEKKLISTISGLVMKKFPR